jgi:hypothetical protein
MAINVTLFIQIANFWVSYAILNKLVFKPILHLIKNKETAKALLLENLHSREQDVAVLQSEKKKNLTDFRMYLKTRYVTTPPQLHEIPSVTIAHIDQSAIDTVTLQAQNILVTKAFDA